MKRLVGGKARLLTMVVALVVLATASSCGGGSGGTANHGQTVAKAVITPKQAVSTAMKLDRQHVNAFAAQDGSSLDSIETNPQLTLDQNALLKAKDLGSTSVTESPYVSVTALVPKQTTFPAWFMTLSKDGGGNTGLNLYIRQSSTSPWKLAAVTNVESGPVQWREASGGWAVAADLNVDPSQTLADYWNATTSGGNAQAVGVAAGSMTSDIASKLNSATAANEADGWAVGLLFSPGGTLPEAVALAGGGILGFAWTTELLKARPSIAPCFPQPETNGSKWDPQVPSGNYQELALTYTYIEGMTEPPTGDLNAVSYAEGITGVGGTACPG